MITSYENILYPIDSGCFYKIRGSDSVIESLLYEGLEDGRLPYIIVRMTKQLVEQSQTMYIIP